MRTINANWSARSSRIIEEPSALTTQPEPPLSTASGTDTIASAALAYDYIVAQVKDGRLKPGDRVPEKHVAASLGISRTPVREALRRLSAEGIIELTHNRGARVSAWDKDDLEELFDLRMSLESFAASLAAKRATPEDVSHLRDIEAQFEATIDAEGEDFRNKAARLNNIFHCELVRITKNRHLIGILSNLLAAPLERGSFHTYSRKDFDVAIRHHRDLIRAISRNDQLTAELCMKLHINSSRDAIKYTLGHGVTEKKHSSASRKKNAAKIPASDADTGRLDPR